MQESLRTNKDVDVREQGLAWTKRNQCSATRWINNSAMNYWWSSIVAIRVSCSRWIFHVWWLSVMNGRVVLCQAVCSLIITLIMTVLGNPSQGPSNDFQFGVQSTIGKSVYGLEWDVCQHPVSLSGTTKFMYFSFIWLSHSVQCNIHT